MEQDVNQKRSASEVQQLLKAKARQIDQHLQAIREEIANLTPPLRETVSKHPMLSVGGALAAGVLIGMLLSRQRGATLDTYLAPIAATVQARMSSGESAEEAVRAALQGQLPAHVSAPSVGTELARILFPALVGWAAQAFSKRGACESES